MTLNNYNKLDTGQKIRLLSELCVEFFINTNHRKRRIRENTVDALKAWDIVYKIRFKPGFDHQGRVYEFEDETFEGAVNKAFSHAEENRFYRVDRSKSLKVDCDKRLIIEESFAGEEYPELIRG